MGRRVVELGAMVLIGDGVLALVAPRRHSLLWRGGPAWARDLMRSAARHPAVVRGLAGAEVGVGLWLALRQYREQGWA